jgi:peptide/nickel transport system substrate-binding protein
MRSNKLLAVTLGGLLAAVAACGGSDDDGTNNNSNGKSGGTLVFGTSADPVSMDGAYVSDGESLRVVDQIFETLVTTKAGGTDPEPKLAESYTPSADGKAWTFKLRTGVKFHDGTAFNAKAVCFNFDRWYNFSGIQQSPSVSYYWSTVFGGFKNTTNADVPKTSLYASCEATDDSTAVVHLTTPSASFIPGLAVPAFSIASPDALTKYNADKVSGTGDSPKFDGTFGTEHPIGTGPFKLESFTPGDKLVLVRNDDYWGTKAKLDKVIFKPIADGPARRQALESGDIQGYDFVDPADVTALQSDYKVMQRPAFNVGYVGFNQKMAPLNNLKIRQAIAHALNRDALVKAKYPPGAQVAKEFMPPELFGYADDVTDYDYNVDTAKQLIKDSGVPAKDLTLTFWYPTDVSRPYMPDPKANWEAFKSDLEAVGFKIVAKSAPWRPDYNQKVNTGAAQMYLLGWTGDFGDPDNFVGTFFRTAQPAWGFTNQALFDALDAARQESDLGKRTSDYQAINKQIMDFLPGVPYVHTQPSLAFKKNVNGYVPSPVSLESFATVTVN